MDDLKNALFSQEGLNKEEEFKAKLKAIEVKYSHWLLKRECESDRNLDNYYRVYQHQKEFSFSFKDELPKEIRDDISLAFDAIYKR